MTGKEMLELRLQKPPVKYAIIAEKANIKVLEVMYAIAAEIDKLVVNADRIRAGIQDKKEEIGFM